ncbi:ABC transporter ATP-binding protein [Geobacter sulfurreducens]|jgi:putative ABC transport system ATP-binding protein|uniref:ABC transporter ATP-binding protein n=1 Tax=Geobacter sulfurreducens TaxID=35554 RepID=UPI001BDC37CF|nr:ABC transporter ATP-binding protein [Geobacter sulfurreducens]QVW36548.1 ABC transporter ATP-binding protein [Geobacter sulfurreducens]UTG94001.1 ABC transporter ATP-binding protein [Geobacter sulfurreducens]
MALIQINDLTRHYAGGDETVQALRGVSLTIEDGEFVTIMGQSGSGKSTLLSVLGGMNHPTAGEVEMAGVRLYELSGEQLADFRAEKLGFVFQSFHLVPYLTALENVMLPLSITRMKNRDKIAAAREALERVGLGGKADRLPNQLSGGEQERVAIARAIVKKPPIILADEPTGNLDTKTSEEVMDLFRRLNAAGHTVVMVTHNPDNCAYANRTIRLRDGLVVEDGVADATTRTAA